MVLPDMAATIFEGEAELAVVIGKRASHVKATDAISYIFGYTNSSTARPAAWCRLPTSSIR